jgi:hypothetical protein
MKMVFGSGDRHYWKSRRHAMPKNVVARTMIVGVIVVCSTWPSAGSPADSGFITVAIPDLSGLWDRGNESWFHAVPGDSDGKPLVRVSPDQQQEAGDYNNPILQPWVRAVVKANAEKELNKEYVPTAHGSCRPSGVPEVLNLREPVQFLQQKDKVTIIYQRDHQSREIYLNRNHSEDLKPSWYGESVGHYEGDTLIVDTIGLAVKPLSVVDGFGTPHTGKLHVIERYRVSMDAKRKRLEVVFRVEDPGAFTMSWKGMVVYGPARGGWEEIVCAENNRSFDEGSLLAQIPEQDKPEF